MSQPGLRAHRALRAWGGPDDLPASAPIPGAAVRVALVAVAAALSLVVYGSHGWFYVGVLLALLAAWQPEYLLAWLLIVFLAVGELGRRPALDWRLLVLLAGLHLLHELATLALAVPWRSWVQPAAFRAPLRRFLSLQAPAQGFAVPVMLLLAPGAGGLRPLTLAALAAGGGAALAVLAALLLRER